MNTPPWVSTSERTARQFLALRSLPADCKFCGKFLTWHASTQLAAVEVACCQFAFLLPVDTLGADWCDKVRRDLSEWIVFPAR